MWKCVRTSLRADVTFSTQTNPSTETLCWLLTDWPCEWDRAGGESTQNANHLVATDWITPLFMQNSPERPAVGICQGRRSCRSFIRGHNGGLSAASHHLTPGLRCQYNDSQSSGRTKASFQPQARFLAAGRVVVVFEEPGQGRHNLEKMLRLAQRTWFNLRAAEQKEVWSACWELPASLHADGDIRWTFSRASHQQWAEVWWLNNTPTCFYRHLSYHLISKFIKGIFRC